MAVAIALGRPGINALLVVSQVILSITLPFITLPLIYLTSSKRFMTVKRYRDTETSSSAATAVEKAYGGVSIPDVPVGKDDVAAGSGEGRTSFN